MFWEVDIDPSKSMNFEQFCSVMEHKMHPKNPRDEAAKVFELFD